MLKSPANQQTLTVFVWGISSMGQPATPELSKTRQGKLTVLRIQGTSAPGTEHWMGLNEAKKVGFQWISWNILGYDSISWEI
jgi:hypothetical protein